MKALAQQHVNSDGSAISVVVVFFPTVFDNNKHAKPFAAEFQK